MRLASAPPVAGAVAAETMRSGGCSSLRIVTTALAGAPGRYALLSETVKTTVSGPSNNVSSIGVTVTVADAAPVGIVTLPGSTT